MDADTGANQYQTATAADKQFTTLRTRTHCVGQPLRRQQHCKCDLSRLTKPALVGSDLHNEVRHKIITTTRSLNKDRDATIQTFYFASNRPTGPIAQTLLFQQRDPLRNIEFCKILQWSPSNERHGYSLVCSRLLVQSLNPLKDGCAVSLSKTRAAHSHLTRRRTFALSHPQSWWTMHIPWFPWAAFRCFPRFSMR